MSPEELHQILLRDESPTLEFKQEFYVHAKDGEAKRRMRDEFIKDVLSLANGNVFTAGEVAYLIIGVGDLRKSDGTCELFDIGDKAPKTEDLLQTVNSACQPPIRHLYSEETLVDGKRLYVITIPFSPYVHETTRPLNVADGKSYSEYVVFTRQGSSVKIAPFKERTTLQDIKRFRFEESKNAPPMLIGAAVGAVIGGPITKRVADERNLSPTLGWTLGTFFFGLFGGLIGNTYRSFIEVRLNWPKLSLQSKTLAILFTAMSIATLEYVLLRPYKANESMPQIPPQIQDKL